MEFLKHQRIPLQTHPEFSEKWVQERIADDPAVVGLGDLILKDKERIQPPAGRLDLLLQDPETDPAKVAKIIEQIKAYRKEKAAKTLGKSGPGISHEWNNGIVRGGRPPRDNPFA